MLYSSILETVKYVKRYKGGAILAEMLLQTLEPVTLVRA